MSTSSAKTVIEQAVSVAMFLLIRANAEGSLRHLLAFAPGEPCGRMPGRSRGDELRASRRVAVSFPKVEASTANQLKGARISAPHRFFVRRLWRQ